MKERSNVRSGANRRWKRTRLVLGAATTLAALTAGAGAASGGGGGIASPESPKLNDVRCLERCLDARKVARTGKAELRGKHLSGVKQIKLRSRNGRIAVRPSVRKRRRVKFVVPKGASSGKPVVVDRYGGKSRSPVRLKVRPAGAVEDVDGFQVSEADVSPRKSYFNGKRKTELSYLFKSEGPTDVRIDVLRGKRGKLVDSIIEENVEPFTNQTTTWKGLNDRNKVAPNGKYKFEVRQVSGSGGSQRAGFSFYNHRFPLGGRHDYGDGLGAGRGHQGQDIFAKCGKPIYAARGGKVQVKASQSAAGNYVVIDGRKTRRDYVYMHMERKGRPKEGSRVRTGERIGFESDTGRATGCHLHFELWSGPGWYEGGSPLNPTPKLKRWDTWS